MTVVGASNVFTKDRPLFASLLWGYFEYSRYREGSGMKQEFRFIKNPKADCFARQRDAHKVTLGYEHLAGLAAQLRKNNVAVEQLEPIKDGETFVSPTTGLTWCDVEYEGYVIPAELVSQLVDEANAALTERAAHLNQGHKPNNNTVPA